MAHLLERRLNFDSDGRSAITVNVHAVCLDQHTYRIILCYNKSLTAPFVIQKVVIQSAICHNCPTVGIAPPYLIIMLTVMN